MKRTLVAVWTVVITVVATTVAVAGSDDTKDKKVRGSVPTPGAVAALARPDLTVEVHLVEGGLCNKPRDLCVCWKAGFIVTNRGTVAAKNVKVATRVRDINQHTINYVPCGGWVGPGAGMGQAVVDQLAPGESRVVGPPSRSPCFVASCKKGGTNGSLMFAVDPENEIAEAREYNNLAFRSCPNAQFAASGEGVSGYPTLNLQLPADRSVTRPAPGMEEKRIQPKGEPPEKK